MKNERSSGPDNIGSSKAEENIWRKYLLQLINCCLGQNEISKQWKELYMISLHKRGSRKDPRSIKESGSQYYH